MTLTITEALAEIKTVSKRIEKKRQGLMSYVARPEALRDPLEKEGGSATFIERERQAIRDLEARIIDLRAKIAQANASTELLIAGTQATIADWLTWRREIAPGKQNELHQLRATVESARSQAAQRGVNVVSTAAAVQMGEAKPNDILVNISESKLMQEADEMQEVLGVLDGLLSLKNATTKIE